MRIFNRLKKITLSAGTVIGVLFSLAAVTTPSLAHNTFLMPAKQHWSVGDNIDVRLTSALSFPDLTWGPKKDRISSTVIRLAGKPVQSFSLTEGKTYLTTAFKADTPGFGMVSMSTKPRFGDIEPEKAEGYFDEIGAARSVRQAFFALPGTPPLHRSYSKHSKAFFCVEDCTLGHKARSTPTGQALEFVAVDGSSHTFQLLRGGKALAGQKVKITNSLKAVSEVTTNDKGELTVSGDLSGVIMLMAVVITLPDQPDGVYHSDYASLVLGL